MESELRLIIHVDLQRVLHKLLADGSDLLGERSAEHHDLLLRRRGSEDLLDVPTHV